MTEPQLLLIKSQTNKTSNTTRQYNCLVVFDVLFVCWGLRGGEGGLRGKKKYCRISLFQAKDQQLIDTLECISKHRLEQTRSAALKSVSFLVYYVLLLLKFSLPDKKKKTHTQKRLYKINISTWAIQAVISPGPSKFRSKCIKGSKEHFVLINSVILNLLCV